MQVQCLQCKKFLLAPDHAAGKKVRCPSYQNIVDVPQTVPQPPVEDQILPPKVEPPAPNVPESDPFNFGGGGSQIDSGNLAFDTPEVQINSSVRMKMNGRATMLITGIGCAIFANVVIYARAVSGGVTASMYNVGQTCGF